MVPLACVCVCVCACVCGAQQCVQCRGSRSRARGSRASRPGTPPAGRTSWPPQCTRAARARAARRHPSRAQPHRFRASPSTRPSRSARAVVYSVTASCSTCSSTNKIINSKLLKTKPIL